MSHHDIKAKNCKYLSDDGLWLCQLFHFRVKKTKAQTTEVAHSRPQRWVSSVLGCLYSLSGSVSKTYICELGSHLLCWLFSVYLLTCILCPSLPCSVSRKLGPPPPPPSFQLMLEGVFIFHIRSGQALFITVAMLLKNGHDSSQVASFLLLMEFQSHCMIPCAVDPGVASPPPPHCYPLDGSPGSLPSSCLCICMHSLH